MACSPKSNASYMAIEEAMASAKETAHLPVPLHLRNAPTKLMKDLNYGKDYMYAHSYEGNFVEQNYLPDDMKGKVFYDPGQNPKEEEFRKYLKNIWESFYPY
ncbi:MAG TPA: replication-associated recombination protein A, partial [Bacteroidia bacterium]|nr:replication-associated recombination protein A [Bacteroidia bacterium]